MSRIYEDIYAPSLESEAESTVAWRMVSDQVMGGLSQGEVVRKNEQDSLCDCLQGTVSLANNGGFIQMQLNMKELAMLSKPLAECEGVFIELMGEPHLYNLHFKSSQLLMPWQSFRKQVAVTEQWQRFYIPFSEFESHRTFAKFKPAKATKFAVVAIGEAFEAKVCVRRFGVYFQE